MTPGWTSRSDDIEATLAAARRWARERRTRSDLADVKRACVGLASVLTALGGVSRTRRRGWTVSGEEGSKLTINHPPWISGKIGIAATPPLQPYENTLKSALNLMTQATTETAAAAEQVGHLSSPITNDDLAERYALIDQLTAGMTPPRRLNIVPPPEVPS